MEALLEPSYCMMFTLMTRNMSLFPLIRQHALILYYMHFFVAYTKTASAAWFRVTTLDYHTFTLELFKVHAWRSEQPPHSFTMKKSGAYWISELKEDPEMLKQLQQAIDEYIEGFNPSDN